MPPKFHVTIVRLIIVGITTLFINSSPANASPLKSTPDNKNCHKDSWLQLSFLSHLGKLCQAAENPVPDSHDSDQDTSDKSTEEPASATSTPKSGDLILFKIDVNLGLGGSGDQLGIGNSFMPSEPISPAPLSVEPSQKVLKKIKAAKPQKLVSPKPNYDSRAQKLRQQSFPPKQLKQLSPKKQPLAPKAIKNPGKQLTNGMIIPLSRPLKLQPKAHPPIKNSIMFPKAIQQPQILRLNQPLKRPMVQPPVRQPLGINRSISKPLPHRGK